MNQDEMRASIKAERDAMIPKDEDHRGMLFILSPFLLRSLNIPNGTELVGAEWDFSSMSLVLHVRHPDLPLALEGIPVMRVHRLITEHTRQAVEGDTIKTYESRWC